MKIREVSVQQINAALNDLTRDIDIKIKQIESLNNEIKNMQSKLEALTKAVNGDFTALDEAIGDNIEYINNNFVPNTRTVNGKALDQNISLTASDVGALPDSTVIPAAQVNSDWNATSGVAEILNKPSIPSRTSDLTNDSGFATGTDISNAINSLDASSVGGSGKYISAISESNGVISATASDIVTMITSSVDLNTMVQVGVYATAADAIGNGCTNTPVTTPYTFFLNVSKSTNLTTLQVFTESFGNRYIRTSFNGGQTWNAWEKVITNNFFGNSSSMLTDPIKTEIRNQFNNTAQYTTFRGDTMMSNEGSWWGYRHSNYGCGIFISRGQFVAFYLDADSFRTKVFMDNL